jgi:formylglycine-generating enzyme required for sulfatase activity/serine/threonine protein kinase
MKKYYPKSNDGKTEKKPIKNQIAPNQLIAKRYLTKFEIRKDAMINTHMAFDRERDINVSLTSIPPELLNNPDLIADLKLELSLASKLNHNNIARLYSIDTWNKISFTVMEYVPGHTLAEYMEEKGGKLSLDESITLLRQIANGLDYAHTQTTPLSHLGLKPQNILLTEDNLVKIANFGIANILSSPAARIPGREEPETLAYRAPEQITGSEIGPWTDIYSLAAIAYEILSGKPPIQGEDLRSQIINQPIKKIDALPEHVNSALLLALSKNKSDRPQSAGDFIAMIAGEKPVPKPGKKQTGKERKKKPVLLVGIIVVLLLFILVGLGVILSQKNAPPPKQDANVSKPTQHKISSQKIIAEKKSKIQSTEKTESKTTPVIQTKQSVTENRKTPTGETSVVSIPEGAEVYINGLKKGITPVVLKDINAGEYDIALKKEGFEHYTEKVTISSMSTTEVTAELIPIYGAVHVISDPPGAEVYLDSIKSGTTPINLNQITKGARKIRVVKPGYDTWFKNINVIATEQLTLNAKLTVAMGSINITSKPDDATVYISGMKHGKTPLLLKVEKGLRKIEIKKSDYDTWKQNVKIMAGDTIEIKANLKSSKGGLQVNSQPSEADVYISGKKRGKTPFYLKKIKLGKTKIEVRKKCFANKTKTISIKSDKLSKVKLTLKPECGVFVIISNPADAKWYIDDKYVGNTPGKIENVTKGKHKISVGKDQYFDWKATFTVQPGKTKTITAKLNPILPDPGATWREPITGMEFTWVPKGCYNMGSNPDEMGRDDDEGPVHKVCVDGVWVGKHEVTQGQWKKIMGKNPSFFNRKENFPVDNVSWNDVQIFIQKMSDMSKGKFVFRLPSEAEWEYACKSGGFDERFAGGERFNTLAWYIGNSNRTSHSVGEKAPNSIGLYDMSGNISEWVGDNYSADAYKFHNENNPTNTKSGPNRVIRGGNWKEDKNSCRSTNRDFAPAEEKKKTIGFRLVKPH